MWLHPADNIWNFNETIIAGYYQDLPLTPSLAGGWAVENERPASARCRRFYSVLRERSVVQSCSLPSSVLLPSDGNFHGQAMARLVD